MSRSIEVTARNETRLVALSLAQTHDIVKECCICFKIIDMEEGLSYAKCTNKCAERCCFTCLLNWFHENPICPICLEPVRLICCRTTFNINGIFTEFMLNKLKETGEIGSAEQCNKVDLIFNLNLREKSMTHETASLFAEARCNFVEFLCNLPKLRKLYFNHAQSNKASLIRIVANAEEVCETNSAISLQLCPYLFVEFHSNTAILCQELFTYSL